MSKRVTFDPTLGAIETDRTPSKEWRKEKGIQEKSTSRPISSEELNSPQRKAINELAQETALNDAGLRLKRERKSYVNLLDLVQNSNEGNSR